MTSDPSSAIDNQLESVLKDKGCALFDFRFPSNVLRLKTETDSSSQCFPFAASHRSASMAALQPSPAAETAWR